MQEKYQLKCKRKCYLLSNFVSGSFTWLQYHRMIRNEKEYTQRVSSIAYF